jgi:phenylpyruvate tautomerase
MPLIKLQTNKEIDQSKEKEILASLSKLISNELSKPEQYVMAVLEKASFIMSGASGDTAYVEVKSLGALSPDMNNQLSKKICTLLESSLDISPVRVYINFEDVERSNWGWNGKTF